MANETTTTSVATLIPEIIEPEIMETAFVSKVFEPVIGMAGVTVFDFSGPGDTHHINQGDTVTFGALAEPAANANQEYNTTDRDFTPIYLGGDAFVTHQAEHRSVTSVQAAIVEAVALAWVELDDGDSTYSWAAQYTEAVAANEIGTDGTAFDHSLIQTGVRLLMTNKAPRPYNAFLDPIQWGEMMSDTTTRELLKDSGNQRDKFRAVEGVSMENYMGKLYGCDLWVNQSGMIESSGLHAMMVARKGLGLGYETISTPDSPVASRINIEVEWDGKQRGYYIYFTVSQDISGTVKTATTNNWVVDMIS